MIERRTSRRPGGRRIERRASRLDGLLGQRRIEWTEIGRTLDGLLGHRRWTSTLIEALVAAAAPGILFVKPPWHLSRHVLELHLHHTV